VENRPSPKLPIAAGNFDCTAFQHGGALRVSLRGQQAVLCTAVLYCEYPDSGVHWVVTCQSWVHDSWVRDFVTDRNWIVSICNWFSAFAFFRTEWVSRCLWPFGQTSLFPLLCFPAFPCFVHLCFLWT
jgi:hypothetical protein